jgi:pimeloyl-ACP methyl ester carboxylesterase
MKYVYTTLNWLLIIVFGLAMISMFLTGNPIQAILLLCIVLILLPPVRELLLNKTGKMFSLPVRAISIVVLLALVILVTAIDKPQSIYKSSEVEAKFMEIYDTRMEQWPVSYETIFLDTSYGKVHVITSGSRNAPPVLLLHAGMLSSWSWLYNIEELSKYYRVYAIDNIGDVGKSVLNDLSSYPKDGKALSDFYIEVSEKLGVGSAYVIGASNGGFIASNYALYAPERVEKVVLLGPMGVTPATGTTMFKMIVAVTFPIKPFQDNMFDWALGENLKVEESFGEWFRMVLEGTQVQIANPTTFTPEQLQNIKVPVLLILGEKDGLVGNPERVRKLAQNIPDIQIEVLNTGHGIFAEQSDQVNSLILEFLERG